MASPIQSAIEAVQEAFAKFHPENMGDARQLLTDMAAEDGFFDTLAKSTRSLSTRFAEEMPVHASVSEAINELGASAAGLRDEAQELLALFNRVHKDDLDRLDAPRRNEDMWDVSKNQQ